MLIGQTPDPSTFRSPDGSWSLEGVLLWVVSVLLGVVMYFYRIIETSNRKRIEELEKGSQHCEERCSRLMETISVLEKEVAKLDKEIAIVREARH